MNASIMHDATNSGIAAVIEPFHTKDWLYPTLFPFEQTYKLDWSVIEAKAGVKIMADIVARGSDISKKQRKALDRIFGEIPKIAISRELEEAELTEYEILVSLHSNNPNLRALVEFWAEDAQFCWDGINARLEWLALQQISLGKIKINDKNNNGVVSKFDFDYEIPSKNKIGVKTVYNGTNSNPITVDFPAAIKIGKEMNAIYKFAFMTPDTFEKIASQDEVIKRTSTLMESTVGAQDTPDLDTFNKYLLKKSTKFRGLQVVLIDQDIAVEYEDGTTDSGNPFENDVVLFSETKVLGKTLWKTPVEMSDKFKIVSKANMAMHNHALIKKYSEESPIKEVTQGIANAIPVWNLAGRSVLMQISATSWNK